LDLAAQLADRGWGAVVVVVLGTISGTVLLRYLLLSLFDHDRAPRAGR
ncbi:MAG: hypothetical protein JOZ69_16555, partial [Myxococcales bacterium]|nr:hypothetical protein [Myxococcales bacterium]